MGEQIPVETRKLALNLKKKHKIGEFSKSSFMTVKKIIEKIR